MSEPLPHDLGAMADADAYNQWLLDRARRWLRGRVLDAGAGIGTQTARLVGMADEVVALEPEAELASLLRRRVPQATVVGATRGPSTARSTPSSASTSSSTSRTTPRCSLAFAIC